jgi:hypothetical protein
MSISTVTTTIRLTKEESEEFDKFAKEFGISKQKLIVNSVKFCIAHTDEVGEFVAPVHTVDAIIKRLQNKLIETAKQKLVLIQDGGKFE